MGGKRPDQYAIDPGEAGATDYKDRRQEEFVDESKEKLQNSKKDARENDSLIPKSGVNPALAELQAAKKEARARADAESSEPEE